MSNLKWMLAGICAGCAFIGVVWYVSWYVEGYTGDVTMAPITEAEHKSIWCAQAPIRVPDGFKMSGYCGR